MSHHHSRRNRQGKSLGTRAIEALIVAVVLFVLYQAALFTGNQWDHEYREHDAAIQEFRETGYWPDETP